MLYKFIDNQGTFQVKNPQATSYLYFPLTNKDGTLLSAISPNLAGDIKKDNSKFLTPPASVEDLKHNPLCRRDFFIYIPARKKTVIRCSRSLNDTLEAGFLYHKLIKKNKALLIEIVNFIPYNLEAEVMWIKIKNTSAHTIEYVPTSFIPLYGRGEPHLRDHRHVTSLLNRVELPPYGIILTPTMTFDEKKHKKNTSRYFVYGYEGKRIPPQGQFPTLLHFCGESAGLQEPESIYKNLAPFTKKCASFDGKENCAAFRFKKRRLKINEEAHYVLVMGIAESKKSIHKTFVKLDSLGKVETSLKNTQRFWKNHLLRLRFDFYNKEYNNWLRWVQLQPTLRKLFGCSFLPHFDYGKGGRGFRDLWQDLLSLILKDDPGIKKLLVNNFKSVRIDGSNATIITKENTFISDRNRILRVWSDHGVWPLLTASLYLHRTDSINLLFTQTPYFKDHQLKRTHEIDPRFPERDFILRTQDNKIYQGTVLEHLLIENVIPFFNVGKHNILQLENGDWNDGLDMAPQRGESVPFYCMYANNLLTLCEILKKIELRHPSIELLKEFTSLLDSLSHPIRYGSVKEKRNLLEAYLEKTKHTVSGVKARIDTRLAIKDLKRKAEWIIDYVRKNEWLKQGFFNGYYDNKGKRVEGVRGKHTRIMLQSQVFPIMSGVAAPVQIKKIWVSLNRYLKNRAHGGYQLNSNFSDIYLDMGRAFGFSYGDKENGAFFNHMAVMLSYAFYKRNFIKEGFLVLNSLYAMARSNYAKIYPMLPEYFNLQGRGLYFYLTGSASWYIYTLFEEVLGIHFEWGNLIVQPKLTSKNFFKNSLKATFQLSGKKITVLFKRSPVTKHYSPAHALIGKNELPIEKGKVILKKETLRTLPSNKETIITIHLG